MTRMPRLLDPGSLLALPLMVLAVVSCSGRIDTSGGKGGASSSSSSGGGNTQLPAPVEDSGGNTTESDASTGSVDAPSSSGGDASGTCTDPIPVPIGGTISGSTCGGTHGIVNGSPCDNGGPVVYFYVEAPAGAAIRINSPTPVNTNGYEAAPDAGPPCVYPGEYVLECQFQGTSNAPTQTDLRLFSVQVDPSPDGGACGDFTITVVNQ